MARRKRNPLTSSGNDAQRAVELALAAECTISQVADLKEALQCVVAVEMPVTLDCHAVKRVDTAGMQLLAAFIRERQVMNGVALLKEVPPAMLDAARLLGLNAMLGLSSEQQESVA
jgi:ABC-type transporter Mla MlaB component